LSFAFRAETTERFASQSISQRLTEKFKRKIGEVYYYLGFTQTNKMFVNKGLQSKKPEIDARPLRKPFKNPCR